METRVRIVHDSDVQVWGWLLNCNGPADDVMVYLQGGRHNRNMGESPLDAIPRLPDTPATRRAILRHFGDTHFQQLRKRTMEDIGTDYPNWADWMHDNFYNDYGMLPDFDDCMAILQAAGLIVADCFSYDGYDVWLWTLPESGISQDSVTKYRSYVRDVLEGSIYGYIIEEGTACDQGHVHWDEVDSCWGFVGDDVDTNGMLDNIPKEMHDAARNATIEYR